MPEWKKNEKRSPEMEALISQLEGSVERLRAYRLRLINTRKEALLKGKGTPSGSSRK